MKNFDIYRFLKILNNKKLYITFILILSLAMGYFYSYYYLTPMYKSSATVVLVKNNDLTESDSDFITQKDITLNQNLFSTYTKIAKSSKVRRQVIDNLHLDMSEEQLLNDITIQSVNNTEVFKVFVSNEDSNLSASITNELVNVFCNEVKSLYNMNNIYIVDTAEPATIPYNINHSKDLTVFAMLGIFISLALVVFIYFFDNTIKSEHDIEDYANLSVLCSIPLYNKDKEQLSTELIVNEKPKSSIAESFKTFRTNIMFSIQNRELNTILVTSGFMSEGKSFVSSNLAITFAQSGKNVILVDADMRKGRQHKIFGVSNTSGLSNCLSNIETYGSSVNINDYIQETKIPNLHIMTSGDVPPNPSELLSSPNMKKFLRALNSQYDIVICDGTPCMLVSDSVILSKIVDTTVVVTANRQTKLDTLLQIKKSIDMVGGNISGAVINKMQLDAKEYKNQYYYGDISSTDNTFEYPEENNLLLNNILNVNEDDLDNIYEEVPEIHTSTVGVLEESNTFNYELTKEVDSVKSDVEEIKKLYKNLIENNINVLQQKDDNFSNIANELNNIKDLYNESITRQDEQIQSLNNKIDNIDVTDNSDTIIDEMNSLKDLYNENIIKQNEQIQSLNDKIDNIDVTDNSDTIIDEMNSLKDLYNESIIKQNEQITSLNDKIDNINSIDNSDILLKELSNIYTYLDNINNRFMYLEEKARNNELLINSISKNNVSDSNSYNNLKNVKENRIIDVGKLNAKVIQIQDYLEETFVDDKNDDIIAPTKDIKKVKNILDGQLNILDDSTDKSATEPMLEPKKDVILEKSSVEKYEEKPSEMANSINDEKTSNKQKKGFSLFRNKVKEDEEPINIVSQILCSDKFENVV